MERGFDISVLLSRRRCWFVVDEEGIVLLLLLTDFQPWRMNRPRMVVLMMWRQQRMEWGDGWTYTSSHCCFDEPTMSGDGSMSVEMSSLWSWMGRLDSSTVDGGWWSIDKVEWKTKALAIRQSDFAIRQAFGNWVSRDIKLTTSIHQLLIYPPYISISKPSDEPNVTLRTLLHAFVHP